MAEVLRLYPPVLVFFSLSLSKAIVDVDVCAAAVRLIAGIYFEDFLPFNPGLMMMIS